MDRLELNHMFSDHFKKNIEVITLPSPAAYASMFFHLHDSYMSDRTITNEVFNYCATASSRKFNYTSILGPVFPTMSRAFQERFAVVMRDYISKSSQSSNTSPVRWRPVSETIAFAVNQLLGYLSTSLDYYSPYGTEDRTNIIDRNIGKIIGGNLIPENEQKPDHIEHDCWSILIMDEETFKVRDLDLSIFVVENPEYTLVEGGKFHNEDGPALIFKDGFRVHCLDGIPVICPDGLSRITAEQLMWHGEDAQKAIMRSVGMSSIAKTTGFKVMDFMDNYDLVQIEQLGVFLRMRNPSTGESHFESVPWDTKTCQQALAFRNHLETYVPPEQLT